MCAPFVMSSLREGLSRRGFFGAAVACAAARFRQCPATARASAEGISRT